MPDPMSDSLSVTAGFREALRRSAACTHGCTTYLTVVYLIPWDTVSGSLRGCALGWLREEYPPGCFSFRFETCDIPRDPSALLPCPFCDASDLMTVGDHDPECVASFVSCVQCQ